MKIITSIVVYNLCITCIAVLSKYAFYEITAFNSNERQRLYRIQETERYIHFLNGVTNEAATSMHVVVDNCCAMDFEDKLKKLGIQYFPVARNVHLPTVNKESNNYNSPLNNISNIFLDWDEIMLWVDKKLRDNSALTKIVIAKTYEQRDIFILKISTAKSGSNMAMFMVAGEEGRDWLSSALLLNYIEKILESTSHSDSILNYYDLYFIPILNPDGFAYSKQEDRFWTKNRKEIRPVKICANNSLAVGINIDRNWFITKSGLNDAVCYSVHAGYKSLSEEETQGLSYILNKIALKLLAFINLRGFENLIALPYSNDKEIAINHNVVNEIMKHVSDVLKDEYNTTVSVGTTANYFYNFSGNMADWVKKKLNIPMVFTLYLKNETKFFPEPSDIIPLSKQLSTIINITLTISKDIYGSLYNKGMKYTSDTILILYFVVKVMQHNFIRSF